MDIKEMEREEYCNCSSCDAECSISETDTYGRCDHCQEMKGEIE